jgi:hypothetical protein
MVGGLIKGLKAKMKDLPEFAVPGGKYPRTDIGRDAYERDIIEEYKYQDIPRELRLLGVSNWDIVNQLPKSQQKREIDKFKYLRSGLAYPPVKTPPRRLGAKAQAKRDQARARASEKKELLKDWAQLVKDNPACGRKTAQNVKGEAGMKALKDLMNEYYPEEE